MNPDETSAKLARLDELERRFDAAVQHAKLEAMKELAYGAGHEINNPLANIATRAQTLLRDETNPEKRRKLAAINAQAFRAHEMIADLMLFARPPQMRPEATDLNALVQSIAQQWSSEAQDANVEIIVNSTSASLTVTADPVQLRVALGALVRNSLEAIDGGGQIEICIRAIGGDGNGSAHGSSRCGDYGCRQRPRHPQRNSRQDFRSILFRSRSGSRPRLRSQQVLANRDAPRRRNRSPRNAPRRRSNLCRYSAFLEGPATSRHALASGSDPFRELPAGTSSVRLEQPITPPKA